MHKLLKPAIRFKEFTNAWEQRRVGELFNISRGYVLSKGEMKPYKFGDFIYPVYSSQTENDGLLGYNNSYLHENSITWTTDGANAGTVFYRKGYFYATNVCGILSEKLMKPNLFYSKSIGKITQKFVNKTNNPKLMSNVMSEIIVKYPNINEQNKISEILQSFYTSITLHQRKLEKLKNIKNMLLEKMFADEKTLKPAIRFKEFTNAWEQRRLGDIADRYDNLRVPISEHMREKGSTPYYGANGIQGYIKGHTHNGEFVLVAEDGANDLKNYPVQYVNGKIWVNNHAHVLKSNKNNSTLFLKYLINANDLSTILVGSDRKKLNSNDLMSMNFWVTDFNEQQKISSLFLNLNTSITLHQRKLEKLKNIKNILLEKMFVNA
ncbi:restriction endonuclease subunit S [Mycoplasmopsis bovigenitalium]|uniref:restriction endonuclease subunit S n=1 Tax=Mycoplasmopsis bovigenitalium TaxID=2112 RepID=UPI000BBAF72F|nr:restriction endonuclease subunit S [Mycoplasmopsis bovigenitalium]